MLKKCERGRTARTYRAKADGSNFRKVVNFCGLFTCRLSTSTYVKYTFWVYITIGYSYYRSIPIKLLTTSRQITIE